MSTDARSEPVVIEPVVTAIRHHSLDSLRAAMMFLGIVLHSVMPYLPGIPDSSLPYREAASENAAYYLVILIIHTFRMPVFFVMAGFFAALLRERKGSGGLLKNRFRRIVLPFAIGWVILYPLLEGTGVYLRSGGGLAGLTAVRKALMSGVLYAHPTPTYLWFLYYLIFLYPIGLGASLCLKRFGPAFLGRIHGLFRWIMGFAVRPVLFAIPTVLTLWPMQSGGFDTPLSFWPMPRVLVAYSVFFGFGWILHAHADLLPTFSRHAWKQSFLAVLLLPLNLFATFGAMNLLAIFSGSLIVWLFVFGLTGLFIRYLNRPVAWMRYLTDSSYWCYLAHFPVLFWVAALIGPLRAPSPVKVLLVIVLTTATLLLIYHFAVRSTFLGEMLNGRRYPRRNPAKKGDDLAPVAVDTMPLGLNIDPAGARHPS